MGSLENTMATAQEINFDIPSWSGKPPDGLHLDVFKGEKLIQKLMVDEKRCYFFGRNPKMCDFAIDHSSCSRVHSALLWHKHLSRMFLIDLGSTHGTFIGNVRLESRKPEQLLSDQQFHFGASSRFYTLREKPQTAQPNLAHDAENADENNTSMAKLLGLPEKEEELENLTEYNTALNRRLSAMGVVGDDEYMAFNPHRRHKNVHVIFNEDEEVINPEDVDPTIGRFRNLVQTAVISNKRRKNDLGISTSTSHHFSAPAHLAPAGHGGAGHAFGPISAKLGLTVPNLAPDVDLYAQVPEPVYAAASEHLAAAGGAENEDLPRKKKYAKEAWPGKKSHLLV